MKPRHDRAVGDVQHVRDLRVGQVVEIAEHENFPMRGGQPTDRPPHPIHPVAPHRLLLWIETWVGQMSNQGRAEVERFIRPRRPPPPEVTRPIAHDGQEPGPDRPLGLKSS